MNKPWIWYSLIAVLLVLACVGIMRREPPPKPLLPGTLAFVAYDDSQDVAYLNLLIDGTVETVLTAPYISDPAFSPDGTQLALAISHDQHMDLALFSLHDRRLELITQTPERELHPTWSPDGSKLAYSMHDDIYIIDLASRTSSLVMALPGAQRDPAWSPAGDALAITTHQSYSGGSITADEVGIITLEPVTYTRIRACLCFDPSWSQDGASLVYAELQNGGSAIRRWERESGHTRILLEQSYMYYPIWIEQEGVMIFVATSIRIPSQIGVWYSNQQTYASLQDEILSYRDPTWWAGPQNHGTTEQENKELRNKEQRNKWLGAQGA